MQRCSICPKEAVEPCLCADHVQLWKLSPEHARAAWFRAQKDENPQFNLGRCQAAFMDFVNRHLKEREVAKGKV